jgi:hypothetical protein
MTTATNVGFMFGPPSEEGPRCTKGICDGAPRDQSSLIRRAAARGWSVVTIHQTMRAAGFPTLTAGQVQREVERFTRDVKVLHDLKLIEPSHFAKRLRELKSDFYDIEPDPAVASPFDEAPAKPKRERVRLTNRVRLSEPAE